MERRNLKDIRLEQGILQREIQDKYGISQSYYSLIENGYRRPSLDCAMKLALALNISLQDIYESLLVNKRAK
ncbi:helix-turn-helix transcriptional regulator [Tissierella creatinini]|nr:helix-turn-helix transcriptional regulator [Tissierella creatinini]TJX60655.1 helix-turn-helix transcriptional regulator [Soehngenia saccharolytica]